MLTVAPAALLPANTKAVSSVLAPLLNAPVTLPTLSVAEPKLAVGAVVSTVMSRVPALLVLPAASVCVALKVSAPWPMALMSAATRV